MNKTLWWIVGLIALLVVAYGGYRVIKHFIRLAATPVATVTPVITTTPPSSPTTSPVPTKTAKPTPTPKVQIQQNIYGY